MASPPDVMNGDEDLPAGPRLLALAGELVRLQPSRTDPEAYFVSKDRIVTELRRLSRQVDYRPRWRSRPQRTSWREAPQTRRQELARPQPEAATSMRSPHCRHCRRRRAVQSRRHRLKLLAARSRRHSLRLRDRLPRPVLLKQKGPEIALRPFRNI
jgi:molybdenum cofactor biosynthesis enzyme MoaA